jgi:hypothetical protein
VGVSATAIAAITNTRVHTLTHTYPLTCRFTPPKFDEKYAEAIRIMDQEEG